MNVLDNFTPPSPPHKKKAEKVCSPITFIGKIYLIIKLIF
jgi:hypothetical protein